MSSAKQPKAGPFWIGEPIPADWSDGAVYPPVVLRRRFTVDDGGASRLEISALGLYEATLNGVRVGDHHLAPEWTDYSRRVQVQSYDVAPMLVAGENTIEVTLADGWYSGRIGLSYNLGATRHRGLYGQRPRLWAILSVNGAPILVTDSSWEYSDAGPVRRACLLDGETRDYRIDEPQAFRPVVVDESVSVERASQTNEPIRITDELPALSVTPLDEGRSIIDFGQNLSGWVRLRLRGPRGRDVRIRHGEMLDSSGELYRENLRIDQIPGSGARQEDHAILSGSASDLFEPRFTYHGFRYVEVSGLDIPPSVDDATACVVHSDCPKALSFECSNSMINRLMTLIDWTLRDNLHSIPTDCPQRDERLGWMGDGQVFAQTACYLRDMEAFYTKWMRDVAEAQTEDGRFPDFAPHPFEPERHFSGNPGWADAGIVVPYRVWQNYGTTAVIEEHFDAMYRWIEFVRRTNPNHRFENLPQTDLHYGDWLNADTFKLDLFPHGRAETPLGVFATALYARSVWMLSQMATAIGRSEAAAELTALRRDIGLAFLDAYVDAEGRIHGDTQTGYAFALAYDLLPSELRPRAIERLMEGIEEFDDHLSTGFLGTVEALKVLSASGHNDVAYRLVTSEAFPSWGYMLANGATTIWERWDGYVPGRKPDEFQDPGMNSFNHYSIGAVGEWIVRTVGGLRLEEPSGVGYRRFLIQPQPGPGVDWAKMSHRTSRGTVTIEWEMRDGRVVVRGTVPDGATARLIMPDGSERELGAGDFLHEGS